MDKLSIVMAYYENPTMLKFQSESFRAMSEDLRRKIALIVVDDGSSVDPAAVVDAGMDLTLCRVLVDVRWNQDACRNIGVHVSCTEWILLTDIDHIIPEQTLLHIFETDLRKDTVYIFERIYPGDVTRIKPHPNSWLMTRSMYDAIGGYDERFAGFYGSDRDFRARVQVTAADVVRLPVPLALVLPDKIPDSCTHRYGRNEQRDIEALPRIAAERAELPDWRPLRLSFPWEEVHTTTLSRYL